MSLITNLLVDLLGLFPDGLIWRFARPYIAGPSLSAGLLSQAALNKAGYLATMDLLGEDTLSDGDAENAVAHYLALATGIAESGSQANVSLKLTQMGLNLSYDQTLARVGRIHGACLDQDLFMRIDIEDSSTTDRTFDLYKTLRSQSATVGVAIQAYLKRSLADISDLCDAGSLNVRICKGIYRESPEIAYTDRQQIRENFLALMGHVLDRGGYPALATHDDRLIDAALADIKKRALTPDQYEFQMLLGVGDKLRETLIRAGHRVRIYIPYGEAWKAYSLRRFKENPTLAYYIFKNLLRPI
jgi:proline dehydrogenase